MTRSTKLRYISQFVLGWGLLILLVQSSNLLFVNHLLNFGVIFASGWASMVGYIFLQDQLLRWQKMCFIPLLTSAGISALLSMMMIIPPFTLGALFAGAELTNQQLVQQTPSPNNQLVAEVYYNDVGAYTSGNGRIKVLVKHRYIPMFRTEAYSLSRSYRTADETVYVSWQNNHQLFIHENDQIASTDLQLQPPLTIQLAVGLLGFFYSFI